MFPFAFCLFVCLFFVCLFVCLFVCFVLFFISQCGSSSEQDSASPMAHLESPGQGSVSQALCQPTHTHTHTQEHYKMSLNTVFTQQAAHILCTLSRQLSNMVYVLDIVCETCHLRSCTHTVSHHYLRLGQVKVEKQDFCSYFVRLPRSPDVQ